MRRLLAPTLLALATPAPPRSDPIQPGPVQAGTPAPSPVADERRLGHFPYADVGRAALVAAPAGFAAGQPCLVQPPVATALAALLAAKAMAGVAGELRGVSCYRSVAHQRQVYCRGGCRGDARARLVAPPGYSEHETGYAIDFVVRPAIGCRDVDPCIASTAAGRWLLANAPGFGFEQSFPAGNAQGVGWEPWHWRWVGVDGEDPAAQAARATFASARGRFPAWPTIVPLGLRVAVPAPAPAPPAPPTGVGNLPRPDRRHRVRNVPPPAVVSPQ